MLTIALKKFSRSHLNLEPLILPSYETLVRKRLGLSFLFWNLIRIFISIMVLTFVRFFVAVVLLKHENVPMFFGG
jgi:hypothetical protein